MKYDEVLFQGKPGSLEILEEKVMFRPELISAPAEESDKAAKPIVRSWRWVAIDRVDVVVENTNNPVAAATADKPATEVSDATDTTTSNRVIKLKAKGQKAKAVSLIAPSAIFDNVVQDLESRLAAHKKAAKESVDDTPLSPKPSKEEIPTQIEVSPMATSAHRRISSSAHESASKHKRTSDSGLDSSQKRMSRSENGATSSHRRLSSSAHASSSHRRLSTSAQDATTTTPTANSKRLPKPGIINGRRKTTGDVKQTNKPKFASNSNRSSTQRRMSSSVQDSPIKNGAVGSNKVPASPTTPSKRSPAGKSRRATMPDLIEFSPKKKKQPEKASTPTDIQDDDKDGKTKWKNASISPKSRNIMDEIQGLPLETSNQKPNNTATAKSTTIKGKKTSTEKAVGPNDDLNVSSSSIRRNKAVKSEQADELEQPQLMTSVATGKPAAKPKRPSKTTTATTKAVATVKKRNSTGKAARAKDLNASASSLRAEETKPATGATTITKRRTSAKKAEQMKESNLSSSSIRLEEARKEAAQRLQDSQKDIVFTPPQESSKPKLNIHDFIGGFSDPQEMMDVFFTPPFQAKEKATMEKPKRASLKAAAAKEGRAPRKQSTTIVSPPFQPEENDSQQDVGDCAEESSGDEYSDSDTDEDEHRDDDSSTSDLSTASAGQHKPVFAKPVSPSKSPSKDPSGGSLLMNPEAPENKFRMMALQHAATCQPSLNSGRGVCPYDPICGEYRKILEHVESCDDEECTSEKCRSTKQFLVTMRLLEKTKKDGINMEESSEQKDFLVGVGAVAPLSFVHVPEQPHEGKFSDTCSAMTDPSWIGDNEPVVEKKGRGRGVVGKSRNRVVVDKSRGRGPIDKTTSELEIM